MPRARRRMDKGGVGFESAARSLGPHPDVLLQSPGSRLASKDGAVAIDRHELRSVAGGLPWITPGIQDECIDPSRSGIANPDPFLPTGVLHVIGFRVRHVDLTLAVEGDSARLSELRPRGCQRLSLLVKDLNPVVPAIADENAPARVHGDGVQRVGPARR